MPTEVYPFAQWVNPDQSDVALLDGLISAWELDEASGTRYDSHGAQGLTDNNTVGAGTGLVYATAAQFVAANSEYLSRASESALVLGDIDFTYEFWVKFDSSSSQCVLSKDDFAGSGNRGLSVFWKLFGAGLDFGISADGSNTFTTVSTGAMATGTWYHVVIWHDSIADLIGISVDDGTPITAAHAGGAFASTASLFLGAGQSVSVPLDGVLGPVRFWKGRVLSALERTALYNSGAGLEYADFTSGRVSGTQVFPFAQWVEPEEPSTDITVSLSALTASLTVAALSAVTGWNVALAAYSTVATPVGPVVDSATEVDLVVTPLSVTGTLVAITLTAGVTVEATPVEVTGTVTTVTVTTGVTLTVDAAQTTGSLTATTLSIGSFVEPMAIASAGSLTTALVTVSVNVAPGAVTVTGTPVTPAVAVSVTLEVEPVDGAAVLPSATIGTAVPVEIEPVEGSGAVQSVVTAVAVTLVPGPLAAAGTPVTTTITTGVTITAVPVPGTGTVVQPTVTFGAAVTLVAVGSVAAIPTLVVKSSGKNYGIAGTLLIYPAVEGTLTIRPGVTGTT